MVAYQSKAHCRDRWTWDSNSGAFFEWDTLNPPDHLREHMSRVVPPQWHWFFGRNRLLSNINNLLLRSASSFWHLFSYACFIAHKICFRSRYIFESAHDLFQLFCIFRSGSPSRVRPLFQHHNILQYNPHVWLFCRLRELCQSQFKNPQKTIFEVALWASSVPLFRRVYCLGMCADFNTIHNCYKMAGCHKTMIDSW